MRLVPTIRTVASAVVAVGIRGVGVGEDRGGLHEAPLASVLLVVAAGLVAVALDYWRTGLFLVAGALVTAALLRLVLPTRDAGLLAVRSRAVNVVALALIGVGLGVLAAVVPA